MSEKVEVRGLNPDFIENAFTAFLAGITPGDDETVEWELGEYKVRVRLVSAESREADIIWPQHSGNWVIQMAQGEIKDMIWQPNG